MRGCFISSITLGIKMLCLCRGGGGVIRVNALSLALPLPAPFQQFRTPPCIFRVHLFWDNKFTPNLNLSDLVSCLIFLSESPTPPTSSLAGDQFWRTWVCLVLPPPPPPPPPPSLFDFLSSLFASSSSTSTATHIFFFFFLYLVPHLSLSLLQGMYHVSHIVSTDAHQTCSDLKLGTLSLFHLEIKRFSFTHCLKVYEKIKMSKSTRSQYISLLNLFFFS